MSGSESSPQPADEVELIFVLSSSDASAFSAVRAFASAKNLSITREILDPPSVWLKGSAHEVDTVFQVHLTIRITPNGRQPDAGKALPIPDSLSGIVQAVLGANHTPLIQAPVFSRRPVTPTGPIRTAPILAEQYSFPAGTTGAGQKVGIVLLGGGVPISDQSPFADYFESLCLTVPMLSVVAVDGAKNDPASADAIYDLLKDFGSCGPPLLSCDGDAARAADVWPTRQRTRSPTAASRDSDSELNQINWTCEGIMDVELLGGVAPGCEIVVYVCPNTTKGIFTAFLQAATDGVDIVSCSWSSPESTLEPTYLYAINAALGYLSRQKITVCGSTGNSGSTPLAPTISTVEVSYPASDPNVLACGGNMQVTTGADGSEETDKTWRESGGGAVYATGGGFSKLFSAPAWQSLSGVGYQGSSPGRGVPDVSSETSFESGMWIWYKDLNTASGGTSASAPVWAGLVARLNQALGQRLGTVGEYLYEPSVAATFADVTTGNNVVIKGIEYYKAGAGWDPCTGLGRPDGTALLAALRDLLKT